jgi:hypothetical protein
VRDILAAHSAPPADALVPEPVYFKDSSSVDFSRTNNDIGPIALKSLGAWRAYAEAIASDVDRVVASITIWTAWRRHQRWVEFKYAPPCEPGSGEGGLGFLAASGRFAASVTPGA